MLVPRSMIRLLLGALCLAWLPSPAARADQKGDAALRDVQTATLSLNALTADVEAVEHTIYEVNVPSGTASAAKKTPSTHTAQVPITTRSIGKVRLMRPNLAFISLEDAAKPGPSGLAQTVAADGKILTRLFAHEYQQSKADAQGRGISLNNRSPIEYFFAPAQLTEPGEYAFATRYVGEQTIGGVPYQVVEATQDAFRTMTTTLYINPQHLITRVRCVSHLSHAILDNVVTLTNIVLNPKMSTTDFAYTPPADARQMRVKTQDEYLNALLPMGKPAPDFAYVTANGGELRRLSATLKSNKAVLINFWYDTCYYCRLEMPHLQELYTLLKGQGFDIVAVNENDRADIIRHFLSDHKLTFGAAMPPPTLRDRIARQYKVTGYPTNYLLDANGSVIWRGVGFDKDTLNQLRAALKTQGLTP